MSDGGWMGVGGVRGLLKGREDPGPGGGWVLAGRRRRWRGGSGERLVPWGVR